MRLRWGSPVPASESAPSAGDETILEFVIRERLNKDQIVELSTSLGGPRQGSKDDLADKLLAIKGLKLRATLEKLSTEDLKLVIRRFDVPEPPKPTSPGGLLSAGRSLWSGEKPALIKRIADFASNPSPPQPMSPQRIPASPAVGAIAGATPITAPPPAGPAGGSVRADASSPAPIPSVARSSSAPNLVTGSDTAQFESLCKFLEKYTFTKRWDEELLYEAELAGAISGQFRDQKVVHQMAVGGTRADLVACGAVIEIKYPKTKQPLQTLTGQVEGYQKLFGNRVIVILCTGGLRDTQAFNDSAGSLSERGAKVFIK